MNPLAQIALLESVIRQQQAQNTAMVNILSQINESLARMEREMQQRSKEYLDKRINAQFSEISELRDDCVKKLNELRGVL